MSPPSERTGLVRRFDELVRATGSLPPEPAAQEVRRFFVDGLDDKEIAELIDHRANEIGELDGAPARLRYQANRLRLERAGDTLQKKVAHGTATDDDRTRLLTIEDLLAPRVMVAKDNHGKRMELTTYRQFLVVDPAADGRVVEVLGDLEEAQQVAVMVPGARSMMESGPYQTDRAEKIHNQAGPHKTATIMWLDYDAPNNVREALSRRYAEGAAERLHRFVAGVQTEIRAGTPVTAIGHSYGSVVVGHACLHGVSVDRVVLTGCPGLRPEVKSAADLGLSKGQLFVLRTPGDKVSYSQWHGRDPASFPDATRLRTDGRMRITGHDRYPSPNTESLVNIARVVRGDFEALTTVDSTAAQETLLGWGAALRGIAKPIAMVHNGVVALTQPRGPAWVDPRRSRPTHERSQRMEGPS